MRLNDAARDLIGGGADATLVTLNPDGSPQVTVVWIALKATPDGDELVPPTCPSTRRYSMCAAIPASR